MCVSCVFAQLNYRNNQQLPKFETYFTCALSVWFNSRLFSTSSASFSSLGSVFTIFISIIIKPPAAGTNSKFTRNAKLIIICTRVLKFFYYKFQFCSFVFVNNFPVHRRWRFSSAYVCLDAGVEGGHYLIYQIYC